MGPLSEVYWEQGVRDGLPDAEMHLFNVTGPADIEPRHAPLNVDALNASLHQLGARSNFHNVHSNVADGPSIPRTVKLEEVIQSIGHANRTLDLLKVCALANQWSKVRGQAA